MSSNFRKTALLVGACTMLGINIPPLAKAEPAVKSVQTVQQAKKVSGTVSDAMGPIIGATVKEKGTSNGVVTDMNGNYTINVKPGAVLEFSYVGLKTNEVKVGNTSAISVALDEGNAMLERWLP